MISEAKIKGAGIQPFLSWYASTWGQERLQSHAKQIPAEHCSEFRLDDPVLGVLLSAWYPATAVHAILDGVEAAHTPEERATIVRDGARAVIDSTLRGVYRWLFETMMNPDRFARKAQRLFSRYYEPGTMTKEPLGPSGHLTIVAGWGAHHPMLCEFILHTAVYTYGAMGCREFKVRRTACVSAGAPDCRFEMTWAP